MGPWLNTRDGEPLALHQLSGRVVLLEFWTFACGNCQRTLPFLRLMHHRYAPELVVVGVHTPELPWERSLRNVVDAVRKRGIEFPVCLDNDFQAWDTYENHYWPSQYLIDAAGHIRYTHVGEGSYRQTEAEIRGLLAEAVQPVVGGRASKAPGRTVSDATMHGSETPSLSPEADRLTAERSAVSLTSSRSAPGHWWVTYSSVSPCGR